MKFIKKITENLDNFNYNVVIANMYEVYSLLNNNLNTSYKPQTIIEQYKKMGIRAFIFSGYPHIEEAEYFGRLVLPHLETCSLPHEYGRIPKTTPMTPLGAGERT